MGPLSQVGRWSFRCDSQLTKQLYKQATDSTCDCTDCMNFRAAGDQAFSPPFLHLLQELGIDKTKPAELCHYGNTGEPMPTHGWFHFVGHLDHGEDAWRPVGETSYSLEPEPFPGLKSIAFSTRLSQVSDALRGHPLVQLEFETVVPWVIEKPLT